MAKAAKQFVNLDSKSGNTMFNKEVSKPNFKSGPRPDFNKRPNTYQQDRNNGQKVFKKPFTEQKPFNGSKQPYQKKPFVSKPKVTESDLSKLFMLGVASSMVFKIFKTDRPEEKLTYYVKLIKYFDADESESGAGEAHYFLVDVNKAIDFKGSSDFTNSIVEVVSAVTLPDTNIMFKTKEGNTIMTECCISRKFINQALANYTHPAFANRK